jgi:formylglycine-generating enzyme required for sulfatase activity
MTFVYIPAGTFAMGSPPGESGRDPDEARHQVTLSRGFYMQTTEVTQEQWNAVMGANPSHFAACGKTCPVEMVSWNDCREFIQALNQKEGTNLYRLPTEAEWEYACRAGTDQAFSFGACLSSNKANYNGSLPLAGCSQGPDRKAPVPVASFPPNAWGLYDLHGNVREWCADSCDFNGGIVTDTYRDGIRDPLSTSGSFRIKRGGDWYYGADRCRAANRDRGAPHMKSANSGFRLVAWPQ